MESALFCSRYVLAITELNFTVLSELMHSWAGMNTSVCEVKRSRSQNDPGPSRWRHTELSAVPRVLISSFFLVCLHLTFLTSIISSCASEMLIVLWYVSTILYDFSVLVFLLYLLFIFSLLIIAF